MMKNGRVLMIDDDELIISMLSRALTKEGYETCMLTSADNAVAKIVEWQPHVLMLDIDLGDGISGLDILEAARAEGCDFPIIMLTADDSAESAIRALKSGASDYLNKPFNVEEVKIVIDNLLKSSRLKDELDYLKKQGGDYKTKFIGETKVIKKVLNEAQKLAAAGVQSILITGNSGSGKEVLARNIHHWAFSDRTNYESIPFIAINCTALPDNLIEGELFGHVKGAFTDAKSDHKGVFELADGGTLLLDEIGDMRLELQSKLLRVLEERKVRRLGGKVDVPVNVNIIACTNRDLKKQVEEGLFREDLYYRLNSFSLYLPSLSERGDDIEVLTRFFLQHFARKYGKRQLKDIAPETVERLNKYPWPGNVRELRNVIERCVVLEETEQLTPDYLPFDLVGQEKVTTERRKRFHIVLPEEGIALPDVEKELMRLALQRTNNNMTKAAKLLKVSYDTFRYQAKKYGLS